MDNLILSLVDLLGSLLQSLQTMTLITALPFSVLMILFCYCLVRALSVDSYYYTKEFSPATSYWSGELWKERLQRIVSDKSPENVDHFIGTTVRGALEELADELNSKNINAEIRFQDIPADVSLTIHHKQIEDFVYGVRNQDRLVSSILVKERNVPTVNRNQSNVPISYFGDNRVGGRYPMGKAGMDVSGHFRGACSGTVEANFVF